MINARIEILKTAAMTFPFRCKILAQALQHATTGTDFLPKLDERVTPVRHWIHSMCQTIPSYFEVYSERKGREWVVLNFRDVLPWQMSSGRTEVAMSLDQAWAYGTHGWRNKMCCLPLWKKHTWVELQVVFKKLVTAGKPRDRLSAGTWARTPSVKLIIDELSATTRSFSSLSGSNI